ncbi:hypothetical protein F5Y18DRAFT_127491 [Xylariaceae sp. FL1019]|nr:hypothetical protein F5Y18DRAFT_127491 [Xylariaceae sp. FL1019]
MRPPRIVILALFFLACLFLLCRTIVSFGQTAPNSASLHSGRKSGFGSFFSFTAPFTLFPPNAIITIADDNTTSFAARPAGFGPALPGNGLNGQLWVGSGFTEELLADGEGEGELGCSDVPGWNDGSSISALKPAIKEAKGDPKSTLGSLHVKRPKKDGAKPPLVDRTTRFSSQPKIGRKPVNDGTDDYLHQHLDNSQRLSSNHFGSSASGHADIQSIQEGAEIEGKIVLLSRGGCGFLEKVKWAQRRGAIGLIVGDNRRGGPLIQMYAHGDTSNITIPSIFTSRTTAYLLSLMMQPGSFIEDIIDDNGKAIQKVQSYDKSGGRHKRATSQVPSTRDSKLSSTSPAEGAGQLRESHSTESEKTSTKPGWLSRVFGGSVSKKTPLNSIGASNNIQDWVLVEDFSDEKDSAIRTSLEKSAKAGSNSKSKFEAQTKPSVKDDFKIGVEDWRDPDLVGMGKLDSSVTTGGQSSRSQKKPGATSQQQQIGPGHGGSTLGRGDYASNHMPVKGKDAVGKATEGPSTRSSTSGLISKIFGDGEDADFVDTEDESDSADGPFMGRPASDGEVPPSSGREGLWVVIVPTSGASPFFDTLLVLVVSPLITLTVVYALLVLRARIRRRRWRAPKSVVERLPVRTYHTVTSTPSRTSRLPSPTSSSPRTPLLQNQQHSSSRPRPRSRTTTSVPSASDLLDVNAALAMPSGSRGEHEKRDAPSQWKKYMGRQVECVVCLEEYVDGVSQVMSLPCGHEFHVDCITPWLTTRRRTCPICKGDVVRSLARGSPSSPRYEPYQDNSDEEEMLPRAASSASSSSREDDAPDLERGNPSEPHISRRPGWLGMLVDSARDRFFARSERRPSDTESHDRDR